jgi:alkylation response protein AidB-like acyl-CoA dehydrogenase
MPVSITGETSMTTLTAARNGWLAGGGGSDRRFGRDRGPSPLIELQPKTPAGARLVASAESLAQRLAVTAAEHDTRGTYPLENVAVLKEAGYFVAPIPEQLGGQGVESLYDVLVASSRLARGDASTTLGLNMHLLVVTNMVHRWRSASHRGDGRRAAAFARSLERIVADGVVIAAAVSEPNQHLTRPAARATRNGAGWSLNGRKIFATMSPAATVLLVSASYEGPGGDQLYGYAEVPAETPGVTIHDDWDALGMRASGSNSVTFSDVRLPEAAVRGGFPLGDATGYIQRNLANGLFHAAASVGIAEAAHSTAIQRLTRQGNGRTDHIRAPEHMLAADNAIELSAMRATFGRAAELVDAFRQAQVASDVTPDELTTVFAEVQAAKTFVGAAARRIVDRALTLAGGAGYMRSHPLSRAYRDVRAGAFMQPLSSVRAADFIGAVALGLQPALG